MRTVRNRRKAGPEKGSDAAVKAEEAADAVKKTVIGLTGGVGCGKSTILSFLKEDYGALVLEADRIAEEMMQPGAPSFERLTELLGKDILRADGTIDRRRMSETVFADPSLLLKVNAIVHPDTLAEVKRRIAGAEESLIVYEAALPEEACFGELADAVLYVYASEEKRRERLYFGRGYSFAKTESIMRRQLSEEEFRRIADAVVDNNGSIEEARASLADAMVKLREKGLPA